MSNVNFVMYESSVHDASASFISNGNSFYLSLERYYQIKHFGLKNIGIPTPVLFKNKELHQKAKKFFYEKYIKNILVSQDAYIFSRDTTIRHHHRHALSVDFCEKTPCDVHVVIDGEGDSKWWSVYRNNKLIDSADIIETGGSLGHGLIHTGYSSELISKNTIPLDVPGKYMGLQSYGKINEKYYDNLLKYNMRYMGEKETTTYNTFILNENHMFAIDYEKTTNEKIDIMHTIHKRAGEIILSIFEKYVLPHEKIGYSGGVAQNIIWNTMLKKRYPNLVVYPHSSDEGMAIGSLEMFRQKYSIPKEKFKLEKYPYCQYDEAPETTPSIDTIHKTAKFLADGKIVAWYQGHGEVGPRALGNRSILMDPRIPNGKDVINRVKNRERYRPFGSSVLSEYAKEYFDLDFPNPYMLYLGYTQKSNLDAITHVDGTSRAQTVDSSCDYFRTLLEHFFELTGCPVLLNTSLNEAGKPIAGWIKNAENLFASTSIDVLVVGDRIYEK